MDARGHWCKCGRECKRWCQELFARWWFSLGIQQEGRGQGTGESRQGFERDGDSAGCSPGFFLRDYGNYEESEEGALQSGFAAGGIVPFLQGVRSAAAAARAD